MLIEREASIEPCRIRFGADEHEDLTDRKARCRAGVAVANSHALQAATAIAMKLDNLGSHLDIDIIQRLDPVDQVARHRGLQAVTPDNHGQALTCGARNTTAWPAELPAPTKAISSPVQSLASTGDAQ